MHGRIHGKGRKWHRHGYGPEVHVISLPHAHGCAPPQHTRHEAQHAQDIILHATSQYNNYNRACWSAPHATLAHYQQGVLTHAGRGTDTCSSCTTFSTPCRSCQQGVPMQEHPQAGVSLAADNHSLRHGHTHESHMSHTSFHNVDIPCLSVLQAARTPTTHGSSATADFMPHMPPQ